jgi:hypothetical protein
MGTTDRGLALFHELLLREAERAAAGSDPMGVVREAGQTGETPVLWQPEGHFRGNGVRVYPERSEAAARS